MTIDEAEKIYMEQIDKSMWNRNNCYKRATVRKAFRNGWKQALEQVKAKTEPDKAPVIHIVSTKLNTSTN